MADPPPPNDPLIATIRHAVPSLLPGRPEVAHIDPFAGHPGVWRVTARDGTRLVAKHQLFGPLTRGKPHDLLEVEKNVIQILRASGCPVPEVYGIDATHSLIFFEWCGDYALDDICQEADTTVRSTYADRAVEGFSSIQASFADEADALTHRAFPGCDPAGLQQAWQQATGITDADLSGLAAHLNLPLSSQAAAHACRLWSFLVKALGDASPVLGATDYNARNIVIDPEKNTLRFIEFSKLGSDWPERRLVQYTTGLGARLPDGGFHSLLNRRRVERYASLAAEYRATDPECIAHALDGHHLVFHLLTACMLKDAHLDPSQNVRLLEVWQSPERRFEQLRSILASPLSGNPLTTELRTFFTKK